MSGLNELVNGRRAGYPRKCSHEFEIFRSARCCGGRRVYAQVPRQRRRCFFEHIVSFAREQSGVDPKSQALFLFFGKRHCALKILCVERAGVCPFYKRLHRGTYRIPQPIEDGVRRIELDERVLDALLFGIDALDTSSSKMKKHTVH